MSLLNDVQEHIAAYSASHIDLLDGPDNKAFVRLWSREDMEAIKVNASANIVIVTSFRGKAFGWYEEKKMQQFIGLRFSSYANADDGIMAIDNALNKSMEIMEDFITRMQHDFEEDDCSWLKWVDFENISWDEIPEQPWLQNHYGWDLIIPFKTYLPAYNAAKWSE